MTTQGATLTVRLGFTPGSQAIDDADHPGLLRAGPRSSGPYDGKSIEHHDCPATDVSQTDAIRPDLLEFGFDTVDLSVFDDLQAVFARVAAAGHIADEDAAAIRAALKGATLALSDGTTASVLYIADEGLIMRTSGPDGLPLVGSRSAGMNGHTAAASVHADQDVYGTPLTQLMDGRAPSLLRHDSPDGLNHDVSLMLVNLWIPLQQITQPLTLADGRSIDRRRHQLRYGLPTATFLERDDDMAINDVWTFLHDPGQRWYLRSDMDHRSAYMFNTLSTPHGASTLPGEDVAKQCYLALEDGEAAVNSGERQRLIDAATQAAGVAAPDEAPPALRAAITEMVALAKAAHDEPDAVLTDRKEQWLTASQAARRRVVRMSLEMRLVVDVKTPALDGPRLTSEA